MVWLGRGEAVGMRVLDDPGGTIAIVLHDMPLGGTERIAIRLANRWAELGREVTVFCGSRHGALSTMLSPRVEVVECDPPIPRGPGSRRRLGQALRAFIAERRPDILFVPGNFHWPVLPRLAGLSRTARPAVVAQISTPLFRHGRGPVQQVIYNQKTRHLLLCADAAISLSPSMTSHADKVLGRSITQHLLLPALEDETEGGPCRRARGKLIVAAGRLVKEKGFDVALQAFALVKDKSCRLVILGEGPERAKLTELALTLGVADRVDLPGYVPDIGPWLAKARAFLLTSFYEGYAAVIVEALAAGRPVVSTDCTPAAYELLCGAGVGAVAPIGDAAALAQGLDRVMAAPPPDPRNLALAVAGYRIGPIAGAYLDIFDAVAARLARDALEAGARRRDVQTLVDAFVIRRVGERVEAIRLTAQAPQGLADGVAGVEGERTGGEVEVLGVHQGDLARRREGMQSIVDAFVIRRPDGVADRRLETVGR
jgi:glycosyltransferase involved in cell wall biosynthesis